MIDIGDDVGKLRTRMVEHSKELLGYQANVEKEFLNYYQKVDFEKYESE